VHGTAETALTIAIVLTALAIAAIVNIGMAWVLLPFGG